MFRISDFNSWRSEFLCFVIGFCVADANLFPSLEINLDNRCIKILLHCSRKRSVF